MKNEIKFGLIGLAIIIIGAFIFGGTAKAALSYLTYAQTETATSTVAYITPGTATTTLSFATPDAKKASLFVQLTASTSATVLNWKYQFSNDNIDWFEEDIYGNSIGVSQNTIEHASTTVTHRWTPGSATASTSRKVLEIPLSPAKYTRVQFSIPAGSANGSLWAQTVNSIESAY